MSRRWAVGAAFQVLATMALLAGCAAPSPQAPVGSLQAPGCTVTLRADIPAEFTKERVLVVPATASGQSLRIEFSTTLTGAATISREAAKRLGVAKTGVTRFGSDFSSSDLDMGRISRFALPGLPESNIQALMLPSETYTVRNQVLDGAAGLGYFGSFDIEIDAAAGRVRLYDVAGCGNRLIPFAEAYSTIPLARDQGGRYLIPITIDGLKIRGILTTDTNVSIVSRDAAMRAGVTPDMMARDPQVTATDAFGSKSCAVHCFRQLEIGDQVFRDVNMPIIESTGYDALIGNDFLFRQRVWISPATAQFFVSRRFVTPQ